MKFRIIGIETGSELSDMQLKENRNVNPLKILKPNTYFPLYQCYERDKEAIKYLPEKDIKLYSTDTSNIEINFSAILGKNGSGKSSILELFYLACYNVGTHFNKLYFEHYDEEIENTDNQTVKLLPPEEKCEALYLNCSIYYELLTENGKQIWELKCRNKDVELYSYSTTNNTVFESPKIEPLSTDNDLSKFFYSIALNFSLFGINESEIGYWVRSLFHKNDGYETPLVINPKRKYGNVDVNLEHFFNRTRLLSNLVSKHLLDKPFEPSKTPRLLDQYDVENVVFKLKEKYKRIDLFSSIGGSTKSQAYEFVNFILKKNGFPELQQGKNTIPFQQELVDYLFNKFDRISKTYRDYKILSSIRDTENLYEAFHQKIFKDDSHISLKFKQAYRFIEKCINNNINEPQQKFQFWRDNRKTIQDQWEIAFSIKELKEWVQFSVYNTNNLEYLPPSIFEVDYKLKPSSNDKKPILLSSLSSGERQMITVIQNILYHLINLESTHKGSHSIKYQNVNILLDEIELYFHPEYQQTFIANLIDSIKEIYFTPDGIKSLNFILVTHSPFILSDIPSNNILKLKEGYVDKRDLSQSFGANIHDLLANDFFLENGFMGEFAKKQISELIDFLNQSEDEWNGYDKTKSKQLIEIIGEPILKRKLLEMYSKKFLDISFEIEQLQIRIEQLKSIK